MYYFFNLCKPCPNKDKCYKYHYFISYHYYKNSIISNHCYIIKFHFGHIFNKSIFFFDIYLNTQPTVINITNSTRFAYLQLICSHLQKHILGQMSLNKSLLFSRVLARHQYHRLHMCRSGEHIDGAGFGGGVAEVRKELHIACER